MNRIIVKETEVPYLISFQLITSVVVFGLFHGLLFLPVILSLAGPGERKPDSPEKNQAMQYHNGYYTVHLSQNGKGKLNNFHVTKRNFCETNENRRSFFISHLQI